MATGKRSSERALQKVLGKGANVSGDNPLEVHDPKVGSLISYEGTTTADGAGDGSTLIDSVLTTKPDYNGNLVIITSGAYAGQGRDINGATTGGTVTSASAFGGQILSGTSFVIVALRLTPAEVAAIEAKLDHAEHGLAALKALIDAVEAKVEAKVMGRSQIFEKSITSAANAGDVIVATITTQPCLFESIVIHADGAQTGDMTSCGVFGGAGKVITFISAADAVQANLDAADKQVAWTGAVRLAATKTIVISLVGTGATAVDLTIVIKYRASVSGGYLA